MSRRKILIAFALALFLSPASGIAFVDQSEVMPLPPPMMGLSGICADEQHLYVMAGGKIMQYGISDLGLLKTVDLPEPLPPSIAPPEEGMELDQFPPLPPPMAPPHGLWTGNGFLFVLAGPVVYKYTTPDLSLKATVELPKPEFLEVDDWTLDASLE